MHREPKGGSGATKTGVEWVPQPQCNLATSLRSFRLASPKQKQRLGQIGECFVASCSNKTFKTLF